MVSTLRFRSFRHITTLNLTYIHNSFQNRSEESSSKNNDEQTKKKDEEQIKRSDEEQATKNEDALVPPTTCCMSNCPNCVWIEYAQKLSEHFKDGGERAAKEIEENITDPSLKAYILMEIRIRKKYG